MKTLLLSLFLLMATILPSLAQKSVDDEQTLKPEQQKPDSVINKQINQEITNPDKKADTILYRKEYNNQIKADSIKKAEDKKPYPPK